MDEDYSPKRIIIPKEEVEYKDHLVAFIDFLGFRERIRSTPDDAAPELISKINEFFFVMSLNWEKSADSTWAGNRSLSIKFFSDCACVSTPLHQWGFDILVEELARLQYSLSQWDLFVRGGLALDKHFQNDWLIFSKAQIKAYDIEQAAEYPRIIIEDGLLDRLGSHSVDHLLLGPDKKLFIDYLDTIHSFDPEQNQLKSMFRRHKRSVMSQLAIHRKNCNSHVLEKYQWLAEYHNYKVQCYTGYACTKDELEACALIAGYPPREPFHARFDILQVLAGRKPLKRNITGKGTGV